MLETAGLCPALQGACVMMAFLKRWLAGSDAAPDLLAPPADRVYLVDASSLVDPRSRNGGGQASPREHFGVLRLLAQFAAREGLDLQAVFAGRPLREAGEGESFKGVRVTYAEQADDARARIKALIRRYARREVVLVTNDKELEQDAAQLGAMTLRGTTLKKSLDEHEDRLERGEPDRGERNGPERGGRGRWNRERGGRPPRGPRPEPRPGPRPDTRPEPAREQPAEQPAPSPAPPEPVVPNDAPPAAQPPPAGQPSPAAQPPPAESVQRPTPAPAAPPPPREQLSHGVLELIDPV